MTRRYVVLSLQDVVFAVHNMGNLLLEDSLRHTPMWVHIDDTCMRCQRRLRVKKP